MTSSEEKPLIAHVIHHLMIGGLENGLVNLLNNFPEDKYRHCIICMVDASSFKDRIKRPGVEIYQMHKKLGHDPATLVRIFHLFRKLKPAIVHTRNLTALEAQVAAWLARVPIRIHGEHGRDVSDLDGNNRKFQLIRRIYSPFVHQYITVSDDLKNYIIDKVGISRRRVEQIYNGVDSSRFHPAAQRLELPDSPFAGQPGVVIGTVGRLQAVKGQQDLVRAFALARKAQHSEEVPLRLVLIGDGPMRDSIVSLVRQEGIEKDVYLAGARNNVADLLPALDVFVLPSLAEGISNTILEAMAVGLPVIATRVGGNGELVQDGVSGALVPAASPAELAEVILNYGRNPELCRNHGAAGRTLVEKRFSLDSMVRNYSGVYDRWLKLRQRPQQGSKD